MSGIDDMPRLDYHVPNLDLEWLRTQGELAVACANEIEILRRRLLRYRQGEYHAFDEAEVRAITRQRDDRRDDLVRRLRQHANTFGGVVGHTLDQAADFIDKGQTT